MMKTVLASLVTVAVAVPKTGEIRSPLLAGFCLLHCKLMGC